MAIEQITAEKAKDITGDYSKNTPYDVATAFGFNRSKDRKALAVDAGIQNYTGQASENLTIKKMLLDKLEELRNQADKKVITETEDNLSTLSVDIAKTTLYDKIINSLSYKDDKITLTSNKDAIVVARNDGSLNRSTDITDIPLTVDGKWLLIQYTDSDTQTTTVLALDGLKNNTLSFREVSITNTTVNDLTATLYSAPINQASIETAGVEIVENKIRTWEKKSDNVAQVSIPTEEQDKQNLEKHNPEGVVLTSDLLQNYESTKPYPGDPNNRSYADVYQERYAILKEKREGKKINALLADGEEPTQGTVIFVGGVFEIQLDEGGTRIITDVYEVTDKHIVFSRKEQKYALTIDKTENDTLYASLSAYEQQPTDITETEPTIAEITKKDITWSTPENKVETNKEEDIVLTEELLQKFDNTDPYPGDPQGRTYSQVYRDRYNTLKDKREGKQIDIVLRAWEEPIQGTITFIWGVVTVENPDKTGSVDLTPYEIADDRIVLYRQWGVKYALVKDAVQDDGKILTHSEPYMEDKDIFTPSPKADDTYASNDKEKTIINEDEAMNRITQRIEQQEQK